MSKAVRHKLVDTVESQCRDRKALLFIDIRGVTSAQASAMRVALSADRIRVSVLKNSSARIAFDRIGWKEVAPLVEGPTAMVYGVDDPVLLSKRLIAWQEKNKQPVIRGGCVEGRPVTVDVVKRLSKMPERKEMLAIVVAGVASPLTAFAGTLQAVLRQFAATVKAVADQKAAAGGGAAEPAPKPDA
jgi:large subunit ribosomal protein L10